jgi:prepilin-type N-terminal cleavage/methylation domain-containing protein
MSNRKGFTLIELLIVVVIIGILAAIAIPKFANTKEKAVAASEKSDLRNLVTAQEAFFSDNNDYAGGTYKGDGTVYTQTNGLAGYLDQPGGDFGRERPVRRVRGCGGELAERGSRQG